MEVIDWGGGLTKEEVSAIETIKNTFQSNNKRNKSFFLGKVIQGFDLLIQDLIEKVNLT